VSVSQDATAIRTLVDAFESDAYVLERIRENVAGPAPTFDRERFWYVMLGCMLTTQQKSTSGSAVSRFLATVPFSTHTVSLLGFVCENWARVRV
jgi:hypothetical protein